MLHSRRGSRAIDAVRETLLAEFDDSSRVRDLNVVWNESAALPSADDELHDVLSRITSDWEDRVLIGVLQCIAEGSMLSDCDPREVSVMLTTTVEGLSQNWLAGSLSVEEARASLEHLLHLYLVDE